MPGLYFYYGYFEGMFGKRCRTALARVLCVTKCSFLLNFCKQCSQLMRSDSLKNMEINISIFLSSITRFIAIKSSFLIELLIMLMWGPLFSRPDCECDSVNKHTFYRFWAVLPCGNDLHAFETGPAMNIAISEPNTRAVIARYMKPSLFYFRLTNLVWSKCRMSSQAFGGGGSGDSSKFQKQSETVRSSQMSHLLNIQVTKEFDEIIFIFTCSLAVKAYNMFGTVPS